MADALTFTEHATKVKTDAAYALVIKDGKAVEAGKRNFEGTQSAVSLLAQGYEDVFRLQFALNEQELCNLAEKKTLPQRELTGPWIWAPRKDGKPGVEQAWVYESPMFPFRMVAAGQRKAVECYTEKLSAGKNVYKGQALALQDGLVEKQGIQSGVLNNINARLRKRMCFRAAA